VATFQNSDGTTMAANPPRREWAFVTDNREQKTTSAVRRVECAGCNEIKFPTGKGGSTCWQCFAVAWNSAMRQRGQQIRAAFAASEEA